MIKLYTANEAATRRKIAQVAKLYGVPKRKQRQPRGSTEPAHMITNISATIDKALDIAISAAQPSATREEGK